MTPCMSDIVISVENLWKQYRYGLSDEHDSNRKNV
jgi:hypothetical protein